MRDMSTSIRSPFVFFFPLLRSWNGAAENDGGGPWFCKKARSDGGFQDHEGSRVALSFIHFWHRPVIMDLCIYDGFLK